MLLNATLLTLACQHRPQRSAELDPDVQYEVGLMHHYGEQHEQAARLFRFAAEKGHDGAQAMLGDYCRDGLGGLDEDFSAALDWYEKAAEQGNRYARRQLVGVVW